jgi:hypothetical protein
MGFSFDVATVAATTVVSDDANILIHSGEAMSERSERSTIDRQSGARRATALVAKP